MVEEMSYTLQNPPADFDDLPIEQQIGYVQTLWDRIATREDQVPVPAWHREVLDARLAEHEADPAGGQPWEQVEADLRKWLADRR
jgi:putative addiction module component (TIGR02574 family)